MKVTLSREITAPGSTGSTTPKKAIRSAGTIWVLRYGRTWETVDARVCPRRRRMRIYRQMEIDGGWHAHTQGKAQPDRADAGQGEGRLSCRDCDQPQAEDVRRL